MHRIPHKASFGVDMAYKTFDAAFGLQDDKGNYWLGAPTKQFTNTPAGVKKFLKWCRQQLKVVQLQEAQIVVEATGVYHELLLSQAYAAKSGFTVCLLMPKIVRHFRFSKNKYSKTDIQDASLLAEFGCERKHTPWRPASENLMQIRALLRYRASLVSKKTMESNQKHALDIAVVSNRVLNASVKANIKHLNKQIKVVEDEVKRLWKQDGKLYKRTDHIAKSMPGVQWLTVLLVIAETNGFSEITSGKQLASYAGLDVIENQSGNTAGRSRVSKKGNTHLRTGLYMAATCLRRKNMRGEIAAFGRRIAERNPEAKKKATVAMMRKQLLLIRTLFMSGEEYDPNYHAKKSLEAEDLTKTEVAGVKIEEPSPKIVNPQKDSPDMSMSRLHEVECPKTPPQVTKVKKAPKKLV